jgi:hypothetical protein
MSSPSSLPDTARRIHVCVVLAAATLSACSAAPGAVTSGRPTAAGSADCYEVSVEASSKPHSLAGVAPDATDIVVAVFEGYGAAAWNTPDGRRPSRRDVQEKSARLVRPLALEVQAALRGSGSPKAIERGGTLGCDVVTYSEDVALTQRQRYLFFLAPVADSEGQPSGNTALLAAWRIGQDDVVATAGEGPMTLADVRDFLAGRTVPSAAPGSGEPLPTTPG